MWKLRTETEEEEKEEIARLCRWGRSIWGHSTIRDKRNAPLFFPQILDKIYRVCLYSFIVDFSLRI